MFSGDHYFPGQPALLHLMTPPMEDPYPSCAFLFPLESASLSFHSLFSQAYVTESNSILKEYQNILSLSVVTVYNAETEPDCLA